MPIQTLTLLQTLLEIRDTCNKCTIIFKKLLVTNLFFHVLRDFLGVWGEMIFAKLRKHVCRIYSLVGFEVFGE